MSTDYDEVRQESEDVDDASMTETIVMSDTEETDNVGDASVEINVEQLIADIEQEKEDSSARKIAVRKRLEEIAESKEFDETYAFDFDGD